MEWEEAVTDELLLGRLGETLTVEASCEFADPFSNIAIVSGFSEGYRRLDHWEHRLPIHAPERPSIAGAGREQFAWILSIGCKWIKCTVRTNYDQLTFLDDSLEIDGGMSGSPILNEDGGAFGIIVVPAKKKDRDEWAGHHQVLIRCLPGRMIGSISSLAFPERRD